MRTTNMYTVQTFFADNFKSIGLGVCVVGASAFLVKRVYFGKKKQRICGVDYPKDTVIVHQYKKGDYTPSLGHFVMKLETYLRIAKIPYKPEYGEDMSGPKGKMPWIEYNGKTMGDSQLIMQFLNEEFNVDLNKSLSKEQRAVAWAIQKWIEEFTYHLNVYIRWCLLLDDMPGSMPSMPQHVLYQFQRFALKLGHFQGIGRHTPQEVFDMMVFDLRQLSVILGDKKFLMGGDSPAEVDCAVFGILSQIRWQTPDSCRGKQVLTGELSNVVAYLDRIKQLYWPDWDNCINESRKV